MRRVILAVTGTIAGLVALLSFKAHVPTVPVAATSGTGSGSSASSSSTSSSARTIPGEFQSVAGPLTAGETTITGKVANTVYGPVQIKLIVKSHKIVKVAVLEQPTNAIPDIQTG